MQALKVDNTTHYNVKLKRYIADVDSIIPLIKYQCEYNYLSTVVS